MIMTKESQVGCKTVWVLIADCLIRFYTVCSGLSIQIFHVNTVVFYAESLWLLIGDMPDDRISPF